MDLTRSDLTKEGTPVALTGRMMSVLGLLVQNAGLIVSQERLEIAIAAKSGGGRSSLRVYVSALSKLLGEHESGGPYFVNERGRGYRFIAPVTRDSAPTIRALSLPRQPLAHVIGRDAAIEALRDTMATRRLVSLVGPGGIGKSTLATAFAVRHTSDYGDGVCIFDLALVERSESVAAYAAGQLQLSDSSGLDAKAVGRVLESKSILLVFDNCEHVLEGTAALVGQVLALAPNAHILTTSREALRADGERVFRVPPLAYPPGEGANKAEDAIGFAAIQLFVERAQAVSSTFRLTNENAEIVVDICRRLDGLPLAIELAAAWIEFLGVEGLERSLDGSFLVNAAGRRMPLPRHRTLAAMVEWSHRALSAAEQMVLEDLSIFRASFNLASALAVAAGPLPDGLSASQAIVSLVAKSLLSVDLRYPTTRYRLLETTRQFAFQRLQASERFAAAQERHAQRCLELLNGAEEVLALVGHEIWLALYRILVADTLAALDWAFSNTGDVELGIRLTAGSVIFGEQFFLHREYQHHIRRALEAMDARAAPDTSTEQELKLTLTHFLGLSGNPETAYLANETAQAEAPKALAAQWFGAWVTGRYPEAKNAASAMANVADRLGDLALQMAAKKSMSQTLHFMGDHEEAKRLAEIALTCPIDFLPLSNVSHKISLRIVLARIAFMQADPAAANDHLRYLSGITEQDSFMALAQILAFARIPISMWSGELEAAAVLTDALSELSQRHEMGIWTVMAAQMRIAIGLRNGSLKRRPSTAMGFDGEPVVPLVSDLLATLEPRLVSRSAIDRVAQGTVGWCAPEVLRLTALAKPDYLDRHAGLLEALAVAERQTARFWVGRIRADLDAFGWADA